MAQHAFDPNAPLRVDGRREQKKRRKKTPEDDAQRREVMKQRLDALVGRLTTMAQEQVSKKASIEERWLQDLRYRASPTVAALLAAHEGSEEAFFETYDRLQPSADEVGER